jgi:hypothetical protein
LVIAVREVKVAEEELAIAPAQASSVVRALAAELSKASTEAAPRRAARAHAAAPAGEALVVVELPGAEAAADEVGVVVDGAGRKNGMTEGWTIGTMQQNGTTQYSTTPMFHFYFDRHSTRD